MKLLMVNMFNKLSIEQVKNIALKKDIVVLKEKKII